MEDSNQHNLSGGLFAQILGVFYMLGGALYCLTCIGVIFGAPWFLLGLALFRGGENAKAYQASGDPEDGLRAAAELMRFVRIQVILAGIGLAIGLATTGLYMLLFVMIIAAEM